jgi:hypothetical protein
MNFLQIIERAAFLARAAGATDAMPQPDWRVLANEGAQEFAWQSEYNIETLQVLSVYNAAEYDLVSPEWKYFYDGASYGTTQELYQITEAQLYRRDRLWLQAQPGLPLFFWTSDADTIRVYPPPSTSGDIMYFRGVRQVPILIADEDVPAIPKVYHRAIAYYAAAEYLQQVLEKTAQGETSRAERYTEIFSGLVNDCNNWIGDDDAELQRAVTPRSTGRVPLGAYSVRRGAR